MVPRSHPADVIRDCAGQLKEYFHVDSLCENPDPTERREVQDIMLAFESAVEFLRREETTIAFVPASQLIDSQWTLKAINKALADNPSIRSCRPTSRKGKPIRNRLLVHVGDWERFKQQRRTADPMEVPAEVVDAAIEAAGRQDEIRRLKGEGRK
jgi:hypothetical protein